MSNDGVSFRSDVIELIILDKDSNILFKEISNCCSFSEVITELNILVMTYSPLRKLM